MDPTEFRWRKHTISAIVVVLVVLVFQYSRGDIDWVFLLGVGVVYVLLSIGIDIIWDAYVKS